MLTLAANAAWVAGTVPETRRFLAALNNPQETQQAILRQILEQNRHTRFFRDHGLRRVRSAADWQRALAIQTAGTMAPYVDRIARGEERVLTEAPVRRLVPTSGTTGGSKLVPYTDELKMSFGRAINAWIGLLAREVPGAFAGRQYWSISPPAQAKSQTRSAIPVGFDEDSAYLGWTGMILRQVLAVPDGVAALQGRDAFQYATLRHLLAAEDLSLISVWNPTFLTVLLNRLEEWVEELARDLRQGTLRGKRVPRFSPAPQRSRTLQRAMARGGQIAASRALWPSLRLLSAWADGHAAGPAQRLREKLPDAFFQPKGLLATEGVISIPAGCTGQSVLAIRSHFLEFLPPKGRPRLAHELRPGGIYRIVITTQGGLYRYDLGDEVEVTGFLKNTPTIRFLGRSGATADRVGEKLGEQHVRRAILRVLSEDLSARAFWMVAWEEEKEGQGIGSYHLFLSQEAANGGADLARRVDEALSENIHYANARGLGQLLPARVCVLPRPAGDCEAMYLRRCHALGMKLGDIKPAGLRQDTGWKECFTAASNRSK